MAEWIVRWARENADPSYPVEIDGPDDFPWDQPLVPASELTRLREGLEVIASGTCGTAAARRVALDLLAPAWPRTEPRMDCRECGHVGPPNHAAMCPECHSTNTLVRSG